MTRQGSKKRAMVAMPGSSSLPQGSLCSYALWLRCHLNLPVLNRSTTFKITLYPEAIQNTDEWIWNEKAKTVTKKREKLQVFRATYK